MILTYLLIAILIQIVLFVPAYFFKTDKLTDLSYTLTFVILATMGFLSSKAGAVTLLAWCMVMIWALRLGGYLVYRIAKMGKDSRFDSMRQNLFAFLRFWVLQGLSVWIILLPAFYLFDSAPDSLGALPIMGIITWLLGFVIETTADMQKFFFRRDTGNKGRWIESGLWRYSRHPNYLGEMLCWIGVYLYSLQYIGLSALWSVASPLYITIILIFVTGIPPLEKQADEKWGGDKNYQEYKNKTKVLVPWLY